MTETTLYRERVLAEIDTLPEVYLLFVLRGAYAAREYPAQTGIRKSSPSLGRGAAGHDVPGGWALGLRMPNEPETPSPREVRFTPEFKRNLRKLEKKSRQRAECDTSHIGGISP